MRTTNCFCSKWQTIFLACRKIGGTFHHLTLYYTGTGHCVMITTTRKEYSGLHWTMLAHYHSEMDKWEQSKFSPNNCVQQLLLESECISLTTEQHGPEWILLWKIYTTSPSAHSALLHLKELSENQSALLTKKIGIMQANSLSDNDDQLQVT